ncbi:MAG: hypothetical protein HUK21_07935, partial [Fibrobacteraceae bacterium]|nr:hypothetical protein [Fibrobacteraceae bacterium]
ENFHNGSLDETKIVVNMPQGLGRYQPEDAANAYASAILDEKGTLEDVAKVSALET